jgi:diguanylate cyclase (GGDEF)-like protein/PAS domain S-box-containing protein
MVHSKLAVLLVSHSAAQAAVVRAALSGVGVDPARVLTWVQSVAEAGVELSARDFDCVLLELSSTAGLTHLAAVLGHDDAVPVIALVESGDTDLVHAALRRGAHDHLPQTDLDGRLLLRSVDYARERHRTRAELRHTEHLYSSVVDALTEGVLVVSASGRIQTANASAVRILGVPLHEMAGLPTGDPRWEAVTSGGSPFPAEELPSRVALRTGEVVSGTVMGVTRADGEFAWLELNATPLIREAGSPPYAAVLSFRDTTLNRAADQAVRDLERRQRLVLQNATEGYVVTDTAGRVTAASAPRHGRSWEVVPGTDISAHVHPDDVSRVRTELTAIVADPCTPRTPLEIRIRCSDAYAWVELTVSNYLHEPTVNGIVLNHRDISQRRAGEDALRLQAEVLDAVGQAVIVTDPAGRVLRTNPAADRIHEWSPETATGQRMEDLLPAGTFTPDARTTLLGGDTWAGEYTVLRSDGSRLRMLANLTPMLGEDGEVLAVIGIGTDITARTRAEDAMHRLSAIVESADAPILSATPDGLITSWNRAAARLYGYTVDEAVGRHISLVAPAGEEVEFEALIARIRAGERIEHLETVRRRKDGTLLDVSVTVSPIEDRAGRVVGLSSISRDITERKRLEAEAQRDRRRLAEAQQLAQLGSFEVDVATGAMRWSAELYRLLGVGVEVQPTLEHFFSAVHRDDRLAVHRQVRAVVDRGRTGDGLYRIVRAGEVRWAHLRVHRISDGGVDKVAGTVADVTDRRRIEDERRVAETQLRAGIENAAVGILMVGPGGRITMVNPAMQTMVGRTDEELVGSSVHDLLHPEDSANAAARMAALARGESDSYRAERRYLRSDGSTLWALVNVGAVRDAAGAAEYFFAQIQDISDRKVMEDALEHLAVHDALTQLPNRTLLTDRIEHALDQTDGRNGGVAVLFVDIDRFKFVNDGMGHRAGDELLTIIAARLREAARPSDTVARFGGDEFVVVCEQLDGPWEGTRIGDQITRAVEQPIVLEGREVVVTASVGIAVAGDGSTAEALLRDADAAMYRAKERGGARVEVFDEAFRGRAAERLELAAALRRALAAGELEVAYQPVVRVADETVVGAEALLRWRHPTRGLVSPAEFIPLAEETGLIKPIGEWVLHEALRQAQAWRVAGRDLTISVNLSARQLMDPGLGDTVRAAVEESGIDPRAVHLEITESVLMDDVEHSIETLTDLRGLGIQFEVDDFGTGYSSLSYLRSLPIDTLKIDRSFVRGLGVADSDTSIVRAIVSLGRALGMSVHAEGVERPEELAELRALGCDLAQGFLWSPAVPAASFPHR